MWGINKGKNVWATNYQSASTTAPYISVMLSEIHVLLVDRDLESLLITGRMLESCQYKVTYAENASAAVSKLSAGGYITSRFDVVMANIDSSSDLHGHQLMMQAVNLGIPTVLLSCDDNVFKTRKAIEQGALFYVKKPVPLGLLQYLWQIVMREKMGKFAIGRERNVMMNNNNNGLGVELAANMANRVEQIPNAIIIERNDNVPVPKNVQKSRSAHIKSGSNDVKDRDAENKSKGKKRKNFCWTEELHRKFIDAIEQLGEGKCFPKDILKLMNVPGLTRRHVASYLQQCRNREKESGTSPLSTRPGPSESTTGPAQSRPIRMFGTKPMLSRPTTNPLSEPAHQASRERCGLENNMGTGPLTDNVAQQYQPEPITQQVPAEAHHHAHNSSSPMNDFFDILTADDMISLIQRFDDSALPQVSTSWLDNALNSNSGGGDYQHQHGLDNNVHQNNDTRELWK